MTSRTGTRRRGHSARRARRSGITLIELILVMALLITVTAVSAPRFTRFLGGRRLAGETRRFIAATRFARAEAMSLGMPTELWLCPETNRYGLRYLTPYEETPRRPFEYALDEGLWFALDSGILTRDGEATMVFFPDGLVGTDSLKRLAIARDETERFEIALNRTGSGYQVLEADADDPL